MQETRFDEYDPADDEPSRFSRVKGAISTAVGALVAMALLLTLGVWFYRLGVRDAQNVPIIRAALEPAKERPADPGGAVAPHQDVSSYSVAESGGVQAGAAVIAPPPPEPRSDDVAMGDLPAVEEAPLAPERPVSVSTETSASGDAGQSAELSSVSTDELLTQAEVLAAAARAAANGQTASTTGPAPTDGAPVESARTEKQEIDAAVAETVGTDTDDTDQQLALAPVGPATQTGEEQAAEEIDESKFLNAAPEAPAVSPVARQRPKDLSARVAAAAKKEEASGDVLAAKAAGSRVQIQLAADPSEANVRAMWKRIKRANSDVLRDRALAIQTTISGGTTFYRLRVGAFRDGAEARAVCQALKARGQDCLVARNS